MPYQFKSYRETSVAGGFAMAQAEPAADLVGAVLRFQGFEALAPMSFMDRAKADLFLPLIINFGEHWSISSKRHGERSFDSFTAGLIDRFTGITAAGRPACLQIDLTPFGARALFGPALPDLAGDVVDLADLLGHPFRDLVDALANSPDWRTRLVLADRFIRQRLSLASEPDPRAMVAWRMFHATGGRARVTEVARRLDMSREHLSRLFRDQIGHSPKTVSRIIRFQQVQQVAPRLGYDWASVAHDLGYADQAHLVREFGQMMGQTPTRWAASHSFNTPAPDSGMISA